jgi:hypothetical protein
MFIYELQDICTRGKKKYMVKKAWKALHFSMRIPKKGNR